MGGRNYRWRESKKSKKGVKKAATIPLAQPPATVEVVGKKRKTKKEAEAE